MPEPAPIELDADGTIDADGLAALAELLVTLAEDEDQK